MEQTLTSVILKKNEERDWQSNKHGIKSENKFNSLEVKTRGKEGKKAAPKWQQMKHKEGTGSLAWTETLCN